MAGFLERFQPESGTESRVGRFQRGLCDTVMGFGEPVLMATGWMRKREESC